ncbi:MAG: hypothetical protein QOG93_2475, partial [Gaiellaceae bacterium]|nr:hypothetical protein [Gaiellaceae bacterium]
DLDGRIPNSALAIPPHRPGYTGLPSK